MVRITAFSTFRTLAARATITVTAITTRAAATITMSPIVPDRHRFPGSGRDPKATFGEIGLAGHWLKRLLHTLFIYKAKARPGWWLIPE